MKLVILLVLVVFLQFSGKGQELQPIKLLSPQREKGKSLMKALEERCTTREYSDRAMSLQDISNVLWAANGINRVKEMKHTAPTAVNWQEIDVYVVLGKGIYLYDPHDSTLHPVLKGDLREQAGTQDYVKTAPLNLIYVADYTKMKSAEEAKKDSYASADAAFIAENVYLFCAAFDMGCVIRASVDREKLAATLRLRPEQKIIFGQTVGYLK
ncbi:MAG: nitroreductase family protein [Mariniphaga sp.]